MKRIILLCSFLGILLSGLFGQVPEGISYQAVARDNAGLILANQGMDVRFAVREGSAAGNLTYEETHTVTTNDFGLFTVVIGEGTANTGTFDGINWSGNSHFLEVQLDLGQGFVSMGTSRMESVPYSQFADKADMGIQDLKDVAPGVPADGQVIKWNATTSRWEPANDVGGGTGDNWGSQVVVPDATLSGSGVPGLELKIAQQGAASGQVLKWNGTTWLPSADAGGTTYVGGAGINVAGSTITNTGDTNAGDDITTSTTAGGDLTGTYPNPKVEKLQGRDLAAAAPANGQVIKWNSTTNRWEPANDVGGGTGDNWGSQVVQTDATLSGTGVSGNALKLAPQGAVNGQVLKWNGTSWMPGTDATGGGGGSYTAGTGINITGTTISNTAPDQTVSLSGTGATTVSGTYPNFTVNSTDNNTTYTAGTNISLSGTTINNTAPDQTVSLTGTGATTVSGTYPNFTVNSTDNNTTYTAGTGIGISGNVITNNGDFDASDDLTTSSTAGGDASGLFSGLTVTGLRNRNVASTAPATGQVLKWDGGSWAPASDNSGSSVWGTSSGAIYYNAGDVGIGTTTPSGKFEISANSSLSDPHIKLHENGNDYARINFDNNNGSNYWTIAAYVASNHRNDRLNFWNGVGGDVMTITGDGEVGIGVGISPKVPFHVGNGRRILFGIDTLGNGDKLMFLPDLHAFRVGTVATGAASTYWNRDSIGLYSFASGYNTRAQGFGATAMGRDTEATNSYAFASGFFSNADGQYSTAMGFNTDALALGSTALGYSTDAEANYSFAAGYFAEAQAIYSVAIGNAVQAQSYASMAVGRYNVGGGSATAWNANDPIFEIGIGTGPSTRANAITVQKDGDVGIGTIFPGARLHVAGGEIRIGSLEEFSDGGSFLIQVNSAFAPETNGNRTLGTSTYRWSTVYATNGTINTSDRRDKKDIRDIQYGLNDLMKLRPVSFSWKEQPEMGTKLGLIAQDVQEVISEVVLDKDWITNEETGEKEEVEAERMGVFYSDLIPVLIKSVQDQQEIIEQQRKDIDALRKEVDQLKKK